MYFYMNTKMLHIIDAFLINNLNNLPSLRLGVIQRWDGSVDGGGVRHLVHEA